MLAAWRLPTFRSQLLCRSHPLAAVTLGSVRIEAADRAGRERPVAQLSPGRGPPLWAAADAEHDPAADPLLQPAPAFEFDQRIAW